MRRIVLLICILLLASSTAQAHDDELIMGHHWSLPAYIGEVHFQLAAMALLGLVWLLVTRLRTRRHGRAVGR